MPKCLTSLSTFDNTLQCPCYFPIERINCQAELLALLNKLYNNRFGYFPSLLQINIGLSHFYLTKLICCKYFVFITVEITPLIKQNTFCHPPGVLSNSHLFASDVCNTVTADYGKRNTTLQQKMETHHITQNSTNIAILKDARANCFCASLLRTKFTRHVMHQARAK